MPRARTTKTADEIIATLERRFDWQVRGLETLEGDARENACMLAIAYATVLADVTEGDEWAARINWLITTSNAIRERKKLADM